MIISHKHKFIYFANGKAGSETIENFNDDITKIYKIIGIELPEGSIKKKNTSKNRSGKEQLSPEAKKNIYDLWKVDIDNFDYPKPDFK